MEINRKNFLKSLAAGIVGIAAESSFGEYKTWDSVKNRFFENIKHIMMNHFYDEDPVAVAEECEDEIKKFGDYYDKYAMHVFRNNGVTHIDVSLKPGKDDFFFIYEFVGDNMLESKIY